MNSRFRTYPLGKNEMVHRNSSFHREIRFQDCKVSWGLHFPLGYDKNWQGNYWMDSGVLDSQGVGLQVIVLQL